MSAEFSRSPKWRDRGGEHLDGYGMSDGYRWILSVDIFGFQFIFGRAAHLRYFERRRLFCWMRGHEREVNNPVDPSRRYWCRKCGTVWPA